MRLGSIIVYRGQGPLFRILSFLLSVFESDWRKLSMTFVNGTKGKPWHVAFVCGHDGTEWVVSEAVASGVRCVSLSQSLGYKQGYQVYDRDQFFPTQDWIDTWVNDHVGKRYDVLIYPWTAVQYIARAIWNRPIPRILDDSYSCWELVMEMLEDAGQKVFSKHDCPMITDLLRALGVLPKKTALPKILSVIRERKS